MADTEAMPTAEQLQDLLLESPGFTEFLLGLMTVSASLLGGAEPMLCAITVERDAGPVTVASSAEEVRRLDEKQYAADEGPCLTALREQHQVLVADLQADERWDRYAKEIAGEGIVSVLAAPVVAGAGARAVLNCSAHVPGTFDEATVAAVQQHAGSISGILRLALRLHAPDAYPEHLRPALQSRAVVDAAVSLIMLQSRCGRDQAMELLQLASRTTNRRMYEIAADILAGAGPAPRVRPGTFAPSDGGDGGGGRPEGAPADDGREGP